ncbi:amidohydrolase [Acholeplasma equirhinis]|uniref:M20 metallopeptidase family protein n=1 Tax=Acholeplasma equirhinis TaxID=555393 RepID=UPI00197ADE6F|nr:M20 family metallopeptidase [Acholeplasma equirhinis]MBN3490444.1 amidohydrolase [Acholeplasma equirhinis]
MLEKLTQYRRELHQIPELEFDLFETFNYVKTKLESWGYEPKVYAKTGLVAVKKGKSKKAIAFRSDMDALPVFEATNVDFKSKYDGKMHACGHDGHMSVLLGLAEFLSTQSEPEKSIVLLFQPAEEGPGGAKVMIEEGALSDFNVEMIFGIHLFPGLPEGKVGIKAGPLLARNAEFDFEVLGTSAHGAMPQEGKDAIIAASQLVTSLNEIISRYTDPLESGVITIGTIHGGEARNIIANKVTLSGTMRGFDDHTFETMKARMVSMAEGISNMYGVEIKTNIVDYYPAVNNAPELYEIVKKSLSKDEIVETKPYMFSEDFAYYQKAVPGFFALIGSRNEKRGYIHPLHSNFFNFDEIVLLNGLNYYKGILKTLNLIK